MDEEPPEWRRWQTAAQWNPCSSPGHCSAGFTMTVGGVRIHGMGRLADQQCDPPMMTAGKFWRCSRTLRPAPPISDS